MPKHAHCPFIMKKPGNFFLAMRLAAVKKTTHSWDFFFSPANGQPGYFSQVDKIGKIRSVTHFEAR